MEWTLAPVCAKINVVLSSCSVPWIYGTMF